MSVQNNKSCYFVWTQQISLPKTKNVFSTHGLNTSLLLFFILHIVYTFDVGLMDFCMFTLGTILDKKLMPVK